MSDKPHVIGKITAAIAIDKETGEEGIAGMLTPQGWMPLIASDRIRLGLVREVAGRLAKERQMLVRLVEFSAPVEVERFDHRPDSEKN